MKLLFLLIVPLVCFSQNDNYTKLKKLPKIQFEKAVNDSISKLETSDLSLFLTTLKKDHKTDLKPFSTALINRFDNCKWPLEMHSLLEIIVGLKIPAPLIENTLNNKKELWDNGQWAEKFWKIIRENKLKVKEDIYYKVDALGQKTYNIRLLLEDKVVDYEIGANPLLYINETLTDYPQNRLYETLEKLNIKDITILSIPKSVELFDDKGADGMIKVLTR
ncbi:hypothetical protein [Flavobacterium sp. N1994]|uniref:hypothetical protein n=1 Tax=Flavobacterium sp. N1994 TaxID=2986827 RepID=UPI0022234F78|nr:hypothetical protein [Flavobacterium sp. N1994]